MVCVIVKNRDGGTLGHELSDIEYKTKAIREPNCCFRLGVASRANGGD